MARSTSSPNLQERVGREAARPATAPCRPGRSPGRGAPDPRTRRRECGRAAGSRRRCPAAPPRARGGARPRARAASLKSAGLIGGLRRRPRRGRRPAQSTTASDASEDAHRSPRSSSRSTSTSRGLPPAPAETSPSASIMSTSRAARLKPIAQLALQVGDRRLAAARRRCARPRRRARPSRIRGRRAALVFVLGGDRLVEDRLALLAQEAGQPRALLLGDVRPVQADAARRGRRQEQHVALAEQLLGAVAVENRARVGLRRHAERDARRQVGLDQAGDDVHRRPLRRQNQVDADGARHLRQPADRFLDLVAGHHHQVGELVDDDDDEGQRLRAPRGRAAPAPPPASAVRMLRLYCSMLRTPSAASVL